MLAGPSLSAPPCRVTSAVMSAACGSVIRVIRVIRRIRVKSCRGSAVGKNVRRKDSDAKVTGAAKYIDDLTFPGMLHGTTDSLDDPARHAHLHPPRLRHHRLHRRRLPRHPRPQHRRADRRRPAVPGGARDLSLRRADSAAGARRSRSARPAPRSHDRLHAAARALRSRAIGPRLQNDRDRQGIDRRGLRPGGRDRRRRVPHRASGAALHRDQRRDRGARRRRHDRVRIDAVSVLRPPRADRCRSACRPTASASSRPKPAAGLAGKEEYPVAHRVSCGAARAQVAAAGQADLRPRRGHGRDDQAPSVDRPASDRPDARRPADGDGHRSRCSTAAPTARSARWFCRAACSTRRARTVCPHVRIRGRAMRTNTPPNGAFRGFGAPQTQFAAEVHMDRIAETLGIDPVTAARDERAEARRHDRDRPDSGRRHERAGGAARSRVAARDFRRSGDDGRAPIAGSASRCSSTDRGSRAAAR